MITARAALRLALALCFSSSLAQRPAQDRDQPQARVIHHSAQAAESTRWAASELQRLIKAATGEDLAITSENPQGPAICLEEDRDLPHDGYLIRSEKGNLIIRGNEGHPAGLWDLPSHGTLWGAMEVAERLLGVRWLMPGPHGEDIPTQGKLSFDLAEEIRGQPGLAVRMLAYLGESDREITHRHAPTLQWMKQQRLTNSLHSQVTGYGHSWDDYLKPADIEANPDWKPSSGNYQRNGKVTFFCTTAPGLVERFAQRVMESMDRNPKREMTSISPTDGGGFCTCQRCQALIEPDPHGKPNHARAILTFYKDVANLIAKQRPGRRLGGFVYYNYQYPPSSAPELPDNLSLCWAPLNYYGYGLLKPIYRSEFQPILQGWSQLTPHFFYHNYSTWMRSFHGAPLPVSLDILKREIPATAKVKAWGARMVGSAAWGVNAPINYLLAKQLWNPNLDLEQTLNEWLQRSYGPGWSHLRRLYDLLDQAMAEHKASQSPIYKGSNYEVNQEVMQTLYAPRFPQIEEAYRSTFAKCVSPAQRARLQRFGDNLTLLFHALHQARLIDLSGHPIQAQPPNSTAEASGSTNRTQGAALPATHEATKAPSIFHLNDQAFAQFLKRMQSDHSLLHDRYGIDHGPIWKGEWSEP